MGTASYDEAVGRAIKVARTEQGLSRRELAERAGISYSYLAEIENGNKPPSSAVLVALSGALGMRPAHLHAAADSLRAPRPIPSRGEAAAAAIERAWLRGATGSGRFTAVPPDRMEAAALPAPSPGLDPADPEALRVELTRRLEGLAAADLEMLLRMAERFGGVAPE